MGGTRGGSQARLLVLGAGREQIGILKAARGRDLFVIACERDPNAPGFEFVDRRAILSRVDEVAIGRLALAVGVNAVIATGSDPTLAIASRLSERLGLPLVHSAEVATLLASRPRQRESLSRARLPQPGSLDLERVDIAVTALLIDGRFYPLAVTDCHVLDSAESLGGSAHIWPSDQADDACLKLARLATEALGIRDGAVRIDLVLADRGAQVVSVRPGCTGEPEEELCALAFGVDLPALVLSRSLGQRVEPPSRRPAREAHACVRLLADQNGGASQPNQPRLTFARGATREAALVGAMKAARRVRFRGAKTSHSSR